VTHEATETPKPSAPADTAAGSYRSILKSTSIIGGSSVLNILIGMVKTKFVAVLLGPSGVGYMSMLVQIASLVTTVSGMGLSSSGVRQVAEAVGTGDQVRIARTVKTLRRTVWLTGAAGMLIMMLACVPISLLTFDSNDHALPIAFLSITILLAAVTSGQACILQGTRRIADLAKISVLGAVNGTVISIPCFYLWSEQGIVVSLVLCAVASLITSWWFARRVPIADIELPWRESADEARHMLTLGLGIMGGGLVTVLSMYLIRVILLRQFSLEDVGIYQAAFMLSGVLVGFVLSAMGTDYYPRLTAVAHDNEQVRQMVNQQTEISILLALPLLVGMMIFAPSIVRLFYAESFATAVPVLRWCLLGVFGRVLSWPLGFVMLAKGRGRLFFLTELLAVSVHVGAVYAFGPLWGLTGAGMAFMLMYIYYVVQMLLVVRMLAGWPWANASQMMVGLATFMMFVLFIVGGWPIDNLFLMPIEVGVLMLVTFLCIKRLSFKTGIGWRDMMRKFGVGR